MSLACRSFAIFLACILCASAPPSRAQTYFNVQDSLALVAIYHSTNGAGWSFDAGWLEGSPRDWIGVTAHRIGGEYRVAALSLANRNLNGTLPEALGDLTELGHLDVSRNELLTGSLPVSIGSLKKLWRLFGYESGLSGSIPPTIGDAESLEVINLSDNALQGPLPPEIGRLEHLRSIILTHNRISGPVPASLGDLAALTNLDLRFNEIDGPIPSSIGSLKNLESVDLGVNRLVGAVPSTITGMTSLVAMDLDYNDLQDLPDLSGRMPPSFERLSVTANRLTFEDLEPNLDPGFSIAHNGQKRVPIIVEKDGSSATLRVDVGGEHNTYQWWTEENGSVQDGPGVTGAKTATLVIENFDPNDEGVYYCAINNTLVPGQIQSERAQLSIDHVRVKVLQDTLGGKPLKPAAFTRLAVGTVDLSNLFEPYTIVDTVLTDANGFLTLSEPTFRPGDPFILRTKVTSTNAAKPAHDVVDGTAFTLYVDNLHIDDDGDVHPDELGSTEDTTFTVLDHTSIAFNLVASIEWPASEEYVDRLHVAFANASNFLLDVTNGQAYIDRVAAFDDRAHWNDADVRFYASNTEWPRAHTGGFLTRWGHVYFPPKHVGRKTSNIETIYRENPINPNSETNFKTLVHEMGHYLLGVYDEYQDSLRNEIFPHRTFSVMDSHYGNEAAASELSAFEDDDYRKTAQFQRRGMTAWAYVRQTFRHESADLRAEIHTPALRGLQAGEWVTGPNDNLGSPDLSPGSFMTFIDSTGSAAPERIDLLVTEQSGGPGLARAKISVFREDTFRDLDQGETTSAGRIRLLGARPGDVLNIEKYDPVTDTWSYLRGDLLGTAKTGSQLVVAVNTLDGFVRLLSSLDFAARDMLQLSTSASSIFSEPPQLITQGEGTQSFTGTGPDYSAILELPRDDRRAFVFSAPDGEGGAFSARFGVTRMEVGDARTFLQPDGEQMELELAGTLPEEVAVLSTDFPPPTDGLPDSLRRVSPVYAMAAFPAALAGELTIYYDADSLLAAVPDAVRIYQWEDGWTPMATRAHPDSTVQAATTEIDEGGTYAAYLDLRQATQTGIGDVGDDVVPGRYRLAQNYPNPFVQTTQIEYAIPEPGRVRLQVYDLLGRRVLTVLDGLHPAGRHVVEVDARRLSSGTYFYRLDGEFGSVARMMTVIR